MDRLYIGCAGWALPKASQAAFETEGSHLSRYAGRFTAVEINSSFYRPHKPATYARWAESVPADFRFSVKVPKAITHERRLVGCKALLDAFLLEAGQLGDRLGCLLVQLPPSLACDLPKADAFLTSLRERHAGAVALEPRHASWFGAQARALMAAQGVALVRADPAPNEAAAWDPLAAEDLDAPGNGTPRVAYYRLHGAPRIYYSSYADEFLESLARRLRADARRMDVVWVVFDNTALGAATANALQLMAWLAPIHPSAMA